MAQSPQSLSQHMPMPKVKWQVRRGLHPSTHAQPPIHISALLMSWDHRPRTEAQDNGHYAYTKSVPHNTLQDVSTHLTSTHRPRPHDALQHKLSTCIDIHSSVQTAAQGESGSDPGVVVMINEYCVCSVD